MICVGGNPRGPLLRRRDERFDESSVRFWMCVERQIHQEVIVSCNLAQFRNNGFVLQWFV